MANCRRARGMTHVSPSEKGHHYCTSLARGSARADTVMRGGPVDFFDDLRATFTNRYAHTAVEWRGRAYSYGELERLALAAGALLRERGMGPGERVAVWTSDRFAFLLAHLGALFGGGVSLPLNPRFTREEMRHFLADSGAAAVVGDPDNVPLLDELRPALPILPSTVSANEIATASYRSASHIPTAIDEPCLILYSSGTTGRPKGVVH